MQGLCKEISTMEKLLTIREAAKILNIHPNTLRNWEEKGLIKPYRLGVRRDRRYTYSEVVKMISKAK